jgi:hypothetical protein
MTRRSSTRLAAWARHGLGWAVFVAGAGIGVGRLVGIAHAAAAA